MKKIDEKRGKFLKRFVNIEFMCFACYDNAEIEKLVQKLQFYFKKIQRFCKFCKKILEILKILLQNYCNQNFLQVSSKVTVFKYYLSNCNFIKKLLKYYL